MKYYIHRKNNTQTNPSETVMGWSNCHAKDHKNIYGYITVWFYLEEQVQLFKCIKILITYDNVNRLHLAPADIKKKHIVPQYSVSIPRALLNKTRQICWHHGNKLTPNPKCMVKKWPLHQFLHQSIYSWEVTGITHITFNYSLQWNVFPWHR